MPCKEEEDEVNREQSYAGINYALQGGGRRSQLRAELCWHKLCLARRRKTKSTESIIGEANEVSGKRFRGAAPLNHKDACCILFFEKGITHSE